MGAHVRAVVARGRDAVRQRVCRLGTRVHKALQATATNLVRRQRARPSAEKTFLSHGEIEHGRASVRAAAVRARVGHAELRPLVIAAGARAGAVVVAARHCGGGVADQIPGHNGDGIGGGDRLLKSQLPLHPPRVQRRGEPDAAQRLVASAVEPVLAAAAPLRQRLPGPGRSS